MNSTRPPRRILSLLSFLRLRGGKEPPPARSSRRESALTSLRMSGLTSAATRFMASLLSLWRRQRGHEPSGIIGPRLWSQTQPQRVRAFQSAAAGASRTAALRFLESLHGIRFAHGDFELSTLERSLQAGADGGESIQLPEGCVPRGRFMERNRARRHRAGQAAFTMVEIALCLGVIAIALVAIIGVLPTGVRVQRDNREDTIINQEGLFLLEAIRSGSRGLDYLTNYFDTITTSNVLGVTVYTTPQLQRTVPAGAVFGGLITNGQQIVSLLTRPKYDLNGKFTNHVAARVRAITGSALE